MNLDQKFAVFCARKCLHLWQAPRKVVEWLEDPKAETSGTAADIVYAAAAAYAAYGPGYAAAYAAYGPGYAAAYAAYAAYGPGYAAAQAAEEAAGDAAEAASTALNTTVDKLKHDFLSTWTDEELATTEPEWIEFATLEILKRA